MLAHRLRRWPNIEIIAGVFLFNLSRPIYSPRRRMYATGSLYGRRRIAYIEGVA